MLYDFLLHILKQFINVISLWLITCFDLTIKKDNLSRLPLYVNFFFD